MDTLYGNLSTEQIEKYKTKLHKKLFWLLLYKDPKTKDKYVNVNFKKTFTSFMWMLSGLNDLILSPSWMVELMSILQTAYTEGSKEDYDWHKYRSLIFDAQSLVDNLGEDV